MGRSLEDWSSLYHLVVGRATAVKALESTIGATVYDQRQFLVLDVPSIKSPFVTAQYRTLESKVVCSGSTRGCMYSSPYAAKASDESAARKLVLAVGSFSPTPSNELPSWVTILAASSLGLSLL